jgi:hypothetical protein
MLMKSLETSERGCGGGGSQAKHAAWIDSSRIKRHRARGGRGKRGSNGETTEPEKRVSERYEEKEERDGEREGKVRLLLVG